jgi:hypothetical protein
MHTAMKDDKNRASAKRNNIKRNVHKSVDMFNKLVFPFKWFKETLTGDIRPLVFSSNHHSGFIIVGSRIPLCMSQRCQLHRCAYHSVVNDTTVHPTLLNIFANDPKRCFYAEIWLGCTAHGTAVSLTPLWHAQRCQWHCCANMTPLWLWTSYSIGYGYLKREYL